MGTGAIIFGTALLALLAGFFIAWLTDVPVSRETPLSEDGELIDGRFRLAVDTTRAAWPEAPAFLMRGNLCLGSVTRSRPDGLWRAVICRGRPMREISLGRFDRRSDAMATLWEARHHEPIDGSGD